MINYIECSNNELSITNVPSGIIECDFAHVGITSLELQTERNSIILFPDERVAQKYKSDYNFYVGAIDSTLVKEICAYKRRLKWKKFLVTPYSLKALMEILNEEKSNYFFMIKEMEKLQSLSPYASVIEDILDFYIIHPSNRRCICTTDTKALNNPVLKEEDIHIIHWKPLNKRNISILSCENIIGILKETIENISAEEKILIMYSNAKRAKLSILNLATIYFIVPTIVYNK